MASGHLLLLSHGQYIPFLRVNHLRTQDAPQVPLSWVNRAGVWQNFPEDPPETVLRPVPLLRVNHLRTQCASEPLLSRVTRAGD